MRGKILVADDSEIMRTTLVMLFRMARPDTVVLEAKDGQNAVTLALEHEPDLIVLDGEMPVLNGYQTAQLLRQTAKTRSIPLVGISAETDENPIVAGLQRLCNVFWAKPVPMDGLLAFVDQVMRRDSLAAAV
ncbi:MAG: response regulator [Chloroflexi bacterium]|nr:response regulator [Chloroflexota bacterium]MBP8059761.1 response regulator [Chloroflexota bacterium]